MGGVAPPPVCGRDAAAGRLAGSAWSALQDCLVVHFKEEWPDKAQPAQFSAGPESRGNRSGFCRSSILERQHWRWAYVLNTVGPSNSASQVHAIIQVRFSSGRLVVLRVTAM